MAVPSKDGRVTVYEAQNSAAQSNTLRAPPDIDLKRIDQLAEAPNAALLAGTDGPAPAAWGELLKAQKTNGERSVEYASALSDYADSLAKVGHLLQAETFFRRALVLYTELLGEKHPYTITSLSNLAVNLSGLGRHAEAEPLERRALALYSEVLGEKHLDTITSLGNLASDLAELGQAEEAEALNRRALALTTEVLGEKDPATIRSLNNLAHSLRLLDRSAEATTLYRRALALCMEVFGQYDTRTAVTLGNLALALPADHVAEAETLQRRALELNTEMLGEKHPSAIRNLGMLAVAIADQGRAAEAEKLTRRALAFHIEVLGEKHPESIMTLSILTSELRLLSRAAEAEPFARRALALNIEVLGGAQLTTINSQADLAKVLLSQAARAHLAIQPARAAVQSWRQRLKILGASPRDEAQLARDVQGQKGYYLVLADADWAASEAAGSDVPFFRSEAFAALQEAMAGSVSQALALTAARRAVTGSGLGDVARQRQVLSDQWLANEQAQTKALAEGGPDASVKRDNLRREGATLETGLKAIDDRLRKDAPQYFTLIRPEPLDLAAAQRQLGPREAVLMVVPTQFGTHVMAVTAQGLSWHRSELKAEQVGALVTALREHLEPLGTGRGIELDARPEALRVRSFDRAKAHQLYDQLIAPVAGALKDKHLVYVAASGALASLPFEVLVTKPPQGGDDDPAALRATGWLAEDYALVQLPSLQSLDFIRRFASGSGQGSKGFAGFGDPVLSGQPTPVGGSAAKATSNKDPYVKRNRDGGGIANISALRTLPRLPHTATELDNMRSELGEPRTSIHLGKEDIETAVRKADLSHVRVLAFATHGLLAGQVGGQPEPGLVFTPPDVPGEDDDGLLTASEITTLKLDADWVILSACNTAAGDRSGEGLSGLARAFFYAGARSLLASHWPVRDDVAAELTVAAIKAQKAGMSRADALQAAERQIRNNLKDPSRAHPSAWAPFSLVGEGR